MTELHDPKGLIRDSFQIEGITGPECRSVFLDWAISVPDGVDTPDAARLLLDKYAALFPAHPMTQVLQDALTAPQQTGRRGGARGRRS